MLKEARFLIESFYLATSFRSKARNKISMKTQKFASFSSLTIKLKNIEQKLRLVIVCLLLITHLSHNITIRHNLILRRYYLKFSNLLNNFSKVGEVQNHSTGIKISTHQFHFQATFVYAQHILYSLFH